MNICTYGFFPLNATYRTSVPSISGGVGKEGVTSAWLDGVCGPGSETQATVIWRNKAQRLVHWYI